MEKDDSDGYEEIAGIAIHQQQPEDGGEKKPTRPTALQLVGPKQGPSRTLWSEIPEVINSQILSKHFFFYLFSGLLNFVFNFEHFFLSYPYTNRKKTSRSQIRNTYIRGIIFEIVDPIAYTLYEQFSISRYKCIER